MKVLYYECFSGISGDMNLGALLDLGVPLEYLVTQLNQMDLKGWEIKVEKAGKMGIYGTKATVVDHTNNTSSQLYQIPSNIHLKHSSNTHNHEHRGFSEIRDLIIKSHLNENVKNLSIDIFTRIGIAEAKVHQSTLENIHFHEVGAIDSIVDIVGSAICIDYLKPDKVISSKVELGSGFVHCEHGNFPVPAPAVVEILKGIPVSVGGVKGESTTPTGAAIIAAITDEFITSHSFKIEKTAYGLGHKDFERPNVLRVNWLTQEHDQNNQVWIIETNIDDMNPEWYPLVSEILYNHGALEVLYTPTIMKKGRPGNILSVMCLKSQRDQLIDQILSNTSTIGIRFYQAERFVLNRKMVEVETIYGPISVKVSTHNKTEKVKPEFEQCQKISSKLGVPVSQIIESVLLEYHSTSWE